MVRSGVRRWFGGIFHRPSVPVRRGRIIFARTGKAAHRHKLDSHSTRSALLYISRTLNRLLDQKTVPRKLLPPSVQNGHGRRIKARFPLERAQYVQRIGSPVHCRQRNTVGNRIIEGSYSSWRWMIPHVYAIYAKGLGAWTPNFCEQCCWWR